MSRALVAAARVDATTRRTLLMLLDAETSCGGPDEGYAWASDGPTRLVTGVGGGFRQLEVNHRTVARMLDAGLVDAESYDRKWDDVRLTDTGRDIARASADVELVSP